jgi:hypothetical protein
MTAGKIFHMAIKHTNTVLIQGTLKFTQIWIFGTKMYHLATLISSEKIESCAFLP